LYFATLILAQKHSLKKTQGNSALGAGVIMFSSIKNRWREARGDALRKEVEDLVLKLQAADKAVNQRTTITLSEAYKNLESQFGTINNISDSGKVKLAKSLTKSARDVFEYDMGKGYGLLILSAYLESLALPGNDAEYVELLTKQMLEAALLVVNGADKKSFEGQLEADLVAQRAIGVSKSLGAESAREAAEITGGRKLSDEEWEKYKEVWERNWA